MNKKKKVLKKFIKKNLNFVITILISIISIVISIIALNNDLLISKKSIYPNVILETVNNVIISKKVKDNYQALYYERNINYQMKIVNIGDGIVKNLEFKWDKENSEKLKSLIKLIDKDKMVQIGKEYPFIKWEMQHSCGMINISKKNYNKNIDYLLSEKDSSSEKFLEIPYEYMQYFEMLCTLASNYGYDINKIMNNITLYINLEYKNIENEIYKKTIPIKVSFYTEKYRDIHKYTFDIFADL